MSPAPAKSPATRTSRRWGVGANVGIQILCAAWLLCVVNVWTFWHSWRVDLIREQRYSITPEAQKVLDSLTHDIDVVIPYGVGRGPVGEIEQGVLERARRMTQEYELASPRFRLARLVHVGREPEAWVEVRNTFEIEHPNYIYLFAEVGGEKRREVLSVNDLADIARPTEMKPNIIPALRSERVAEALTTAIQRVTQPTKPKVLFTVGHGELPTTAQNRYSAEQFRDAVRDRGYEVGEIDLRVESTIPADTACLILIGGGTGQFDMLQGGSRQAVLSYLDRGGSLFLFLPITARCGLEPRLRDYGIEVLDGIVYNRGRSRSGAVMPTDNLLVRRFNYQHPIAAGFRRGEYLAPVTQFRPLKIENPARGLLFTDPEEPWLERTPEQPMRDADEERGPFTLMAASAPEAADDRQGRLVVVGSWTPALNDQFQWPGVRRVLLNSVYWLTDREDLAAAPGKEAFVSRIILDPGRQSAFFWTSIVVLPICSIFGGLLVFWRRR